MVKNQSSNTGDVDSIPGWGTKIPHAVEQLSLCTTAAEPAHWNCRGRVLCVLHLERREGPVHRN